MTYSYGACEVEGSPNQRAIAQQANAQGITWFVSSGLSGAATCDRDSPTPQATKGATVSAPSSFPEVTAVGGPSSTKAQAQATGQAPIRPTGPPRCYTFRSGHGTTLRRPTAWKEAGAARAVFMRSHCGKPVRRAQRRRPRRARYLPAWHRRTIGDIWCSPAGSNLSMAARRFPAPRSRVWRPC